jgi:HEAT repeat protein
MNRCELPSAGAKAAVFLLLVTVVSGSYRMAWGDPQLAPAPQDTETLRVPEGPAHADVLDAYLRGKPAAGLLERIEAGIHDDVAKRWQDLTDKQKWSLLQLDNCVGHAEAVPFVLRELESRKRPARHRALCWLGRNRVTELKPRLFQMLATEKSDLRWNILEILTSIGGEDVVDVLIGLLAPDSWVAKGKYAVHPPGPPLSCWPDERWKIIRALGELQAKRSAPVLLKVLQERGEGRAYLAAFTIPLLGEFNHQEAIPILKTILASDDASALSPDAEAHERKGADWDIKRHTVRALLQLGVRLRLDLLARELTVKDGNRRRFATETFARFGEKGDVPLLAGRLKDEDPQVRHWACFGLERITGVTNRVDGRAESLEQDVPDWLKWWKTHRNDYEKP